MQQAQCSWLGAELVRHCRLAAAAASAAVAAAAAAASVAAAAPVDRADTS